MFLHHESKMDLQSRSAVIDDIFSNLLTVTLKSAPGVDQYSKYKVPAV